MIPNFFIVGTPKAGTTSLYHYLEAHPDIYMSPIKETNYFSHNEIKAQDLFYKGEHVDTTKKYLAQFKAVTTEKAVGEASVSYLFYPPVSAKIKTFNPDAKIIIMLRNPVDRGFSHYLMDKRLGFVNLSFSDIVYKKVKSHKASLYYQQYVELGLYYEQLKRYFEVFDKKKIKIFLYEDMLNSLGETVKEVYRFLEVDENFTPDLGIKHNAFIAPKSQVIQNLYKHKIVRSLVKVFAGERLRRLLKDKFFSKEKKEMLEPDTKAKLLNIYSEDIRKTAMLINRDLQHWKS